MIKVSIIFNYNTKVRIYRYNPIYLSIILNINKR